MTNLTSTLLKVDLAVLSCILGIALLIWNALRKIQEDNILAAQQRTKIEQLVVFYGERLDKVENWISGNSGLRLR
ncbi:MULTISPECIES: hypothetical protein [unclassified Microcoleus]|uniref:hypothetical protein n=1 Tax=unclassified Microcoleus TaxID=2642155 RepID=UPI0025DE868B|nr:MULTISPECIES: hypothetical protein [unclassified Microcoleus]